MFDFRRLILGAALALPPLVSTCKSSSEPAKVATSIVLTPAGPVTFGAVGRTRQFTASVKDQNGGTMATATVTWSSNNSSAVSVDASSGLATAVANGTAQVTATSGSATHSASVTVAQAGAQITKVTGDAQSATVSQALGQPLVVQVADSTAHPAVGITVAFAIATGAGSVGTASAVTSASGQAQSSWTLGATAGSQTVTATVAGATGSPLTFTATANVGAAASVAVQAGNGQTAATGTVLTQAPAVIVKDAFNNATPGVTVTFAPKAGQGSVTGATPTTNANGIATVGSWTLGNAGQDTLIATVTGSGITGNPVVFLATSVTPGVPTNVVAFAGGNGPGLVGYAVNVRPAVRVTDISGFGVSGVTVTFAVATGGGSGTNLGRTTNVNGVAQVGSWVLGAGAGTNTMTATVSGSSPAGNPVTFTDTGYASGYDIQIQYYGPPASATIQTAMTAAATKWQSLIYRPVGAAAVNVPINTCGNGTPALNQTVTNLLILAKFDSIDGPGKILGQAGPCLIRTTSGITAVGAMVFDTADVATMITNGTLGSVMLHEMGHVIGFGTLWNSAPNSWLQLNSTPPGTIIDTYFSGPQGRAAFDSIGGTSYTGAGQTVGGNKVPVENCGNSPYVSPTCGTGTVNGHWRETVFVTELMSGFISVGPNPLSVVSVAAQEDLGYVVNYAAADAYVHTFTAPAVGGAPGFAMGDDIRHGPIYVIDPSGKVVRVVQPR